MAASKLLRCLDCCWRSTRRCTAAERRSPADVLLLSLKNTCCCCCCCCCRCFWRPLTSRRSSWLSVVPRLSNAADLHVPQSKWTRSFLTTHQRTTRYSLLCKVDKQQNQRDSKQMVQEAQLSQRDRAISWNLVNGCITVRQIAFEMTPKRKWPGRSLKATHRIWRHDSIGYISLHISGL